jgi:hypothetical protein
MAACGTKVPDVSGETIMLKQFLVVLSTAFAFLSGAANAVLIDFEGLANGTEITNQFAGVTFSSTAGFTNYVTTQPGIGEGDNFLCSGAGGSINCVAETILSFLNPVNDLSFLQVGDNATGVVAQVDVYENGVFSATVDILGDNNFSLSNLVDLTLFVNVTQIRIFNITDPGGLGWDNFSFDMASMGDVPLPAAMWLFLAGIGGLYARARKTA